MVDPVHTSKIIFLLFLIGICFFGFGLDFISRFCASEITVNESVEQKQALKPPAITICPQVGWKNSNTSTEAGFKVNCEKANSAEKFWNCLEEKTYNFSEIVLSATHGLPDFPDRKVKNLSDEKQFWKWSTPNRQLGKCHTLLYEQPLQIDMTDDAIVINLSSPELYYTVYLHDPDFFMTSFNPFAMPMSIIHFNPKELSSGHLALPMAQVRTEKLNRAEMPCNPSPHYSFTTCIKESLVKIVNCSLPWDPPKLGFSKCACFFLLQIIFF